PRLALICVSFSMSLSLGEVMRQKPARIELQILEPAQRGPVKDFPVSVGLVFPKGELASVPRGQLLNDLGENVTFEAEATGWWLGEEKSVKWLLLCFRASTERRYFYEPNSQGESNEANKLARLENNDITIVTGPLRILVRKEGNRLFDQVLFNEKEHISQDVPSIILIPDGDNAVLCNFSEPEIKLEENSSERAVVKKSGYFQGPNDQRLTRIDSRIEFFRNETFVRIYHTITWMVQDPVVGLQEYALQIGSPINAEKVRIGLSEYTNEALDVAVNENPAVLAFHQKPDEFIISSSGAKLKSGPRLGGWIACEDSDGRGFGISLRESWQTYPTAFAFRDKKLVVKFWPKEAGRMGFEKKDIMPAKYFNDSKYWNRPWPFARGVAGTFAHHSIPVPA
ncbi:MAG: hypothetical protein QGF00_12515, partial [Planctomycetota bacterium]|nr:hypothetical protein [Planctomycetota bacterium]